MKVTAEEARETHDKLREILIRYGNLEYGDCIVDEISWLFAHPTTMDVEQEEQQYIITECDSTYYINEIPIENDVFSKELVDYRIEEREELINNLIGWIGEAEGVNKKLMVDDLKILLKVEDRFILSSTSTNHYLYGNSEQFKEECENILKTNNKLNK